MDTQTSPHGPKSTVNQAQIIVFALIMGVVTFAVVAFFLGPVGGPLEDGEPDDALASIFPAILAGQGVVVVAGAFFMRGVLAKKVTGRLDGAREEVAAGVMPAELLTATIISAALVESMGLLGCVGYLLEAKTVYLAAPMIAVALMAFWVPTRSSVGDWLEALS